MQTFICFTELIGLYCMFHKKSKEAHSLQLTDNFFTVRLLHMKQDSCYIHIHIHSIVAQNHSRQFVPLDGKFLVSVLVFFSLSYCLHRKIEAQHVDSTLNYYMDLFCLLDTPAKSKGKPSLEMVCPCDRKQSRTSKQANKNKAGKHKKV